MHIDQKLMNMLSEDYDLDSLNNSAGLKISNWLHVNCNVMCWQCVVRDQNRLHQKLHVVACNIVCCQYVLSGCSTACNLKCV